MKFQRKPLTLSKLAKRKMSINFDLLTLKAFLLENAEFLTGARFQKIQQPRRTEFVFGLRNLGETRKLYVNIHTNFYHLCFMSKESEAKRLIDIPKSPPMFCMLLRKYLEGAKVVKVTMPENERILEFYFEAYNELSEKIYLCLAIELMGKHSNVVLYNFDTNIIIGCAHNVGAEKSRHREMIGGLPYAYPPRQAKKDLLATSFEEFLGDLEKFKSRLGFQPNNIKPEDEIFRFLNDNYIGISQVFAKHVCSKFKDSKVGWVCQPNNIDKCKNEKELFSKLQEYLSLKNIFPAISVDWSEFSLYEELLGEGMLVKDVNEMIDKYFAHHQESENIKVLKSKFFSLVNAKLKKINNSRDKVQKQISSVEKSDTYRKKGDMIMANLYANKDFSKFIEVFDYETDSNVKIDLDETKTLKENANKYYKLYTKAKTTVVKSTELLEGLNSEKDYLEQILYSVNQAQGVFELLEIGEEIAGLNKSCHPELGSGSNHKAKVGKVPKRVQPDIKDNIIQHKIDGFTVYVGKNNKQNDYIVSKLSRDEDFWFHTRTCAGSHVLLKVEAGQEPSDEILFECAKLAKEHSSAKNSSKVGVIYTKRKFLKKPPGANLGYVIYKNEKEIIIP